MKFNIGDNVIFINNSKTIYAWDLVDYKIYKIENFSIRSSEFMYSVSDNDSNTTQSWYFECDFISLQEYRKIKLNEIKQLS